MLLIPLLLAALASPASAATLCSPKVGETGCVSGTVGSRANPVEGAVVVLVAPDGTEQSETTEADGKFAFEVTEKGDYFLTLDEESLGGELELLPPPAQFAGPDGSVKATVKLGQLTVPALNVRPVGFNNDAISKSDQLLNGTVNGLRLGLLLALASVGLSLIYGTTGLSNFAHAEQVTLGGMVAYGLVSTQVLGLNLWLGVVLTVVITALSGLLQDVVLWKPLRKRGFGLTQLLIVTIGMSLALQYTFQYVVGAGQVKVTLEQYGVRNWGPVTITNMSLIAMGVALVAILVVGYVLVFTRVGQATRAVSDNPALASASGIDVDRIIRYVWIASAGLAGLSGVFYALAISNGIRWDTGMQILLLLFAAVTLGGLGTAFGALVGSIVIGLIVELSGPLGAPGDLKYAVALGILIVLLMFRPQGLLGKTSRVG
ncbi:hypothetical protein GCM10027020_08700 [Nocardioides salsibiostraticola]